MSIFKLSFLASERIGAMDHCLHSGFGICVLTNVFNSFSYF